MENIEMIHAVDTVEIMVKLYFYIFSVSFALFGHFAPTGTVLSLYLEITAPIQK